MTALVSTMSSVFLVTWEPRGLHCTENLDPHDGLVEVEGGLKRLELLEQIVDELLPLTWGTPGCRRLAFQDKARRIDRLPWQHVDYEALISTRPSSKT